MQYGNNSFRPLAIGMGEAVAKRTVLRRREDGTLENWGDVAERVAMGNVALDTTTDMSEEYGRLRAHIANGSILLSGRHLQHGDLTQPTRNQEVFINCASASVTFMSYYLLLNGSGVGRSYDDAMCLVDWTKMPFVHAVMDEGHKDFDYKCMESLSDAKAKYGKGCQVFEVEDSREGWAKAIELIETLAYSGRHSKDIVLLDFTKVRPNGLPIRGMQNRLSSGPVPLMNAIQSLSTLKGSHMPLWKQALYADHYLAESVLVGGSRRSSRIAIKYWRDPGILEFISVKNNEKNKKKNFLFTGNHSIGVDEDFWRECATEGTWANTVFLAATENAYNWGEPGFINLHKLHVNNNGLVEMTDGKYAASKRFQPSEAGVKLLGALAKVNRTARFSMVVNPCQPGYVKLLTFNGPRSLLAINEGDIVWTGERWATMTEKWSTGFKNVNRYWLSNGTYLDMTENHRIVQHGIKTEIKFAESIDHASMAPLQFGQKSITQEEREMALVAGMVIGNGSMLKNGGITAYLDLGVKDDDMEAAAKPYIINILPKSNGHCKLAKLKCGFDGLHLEYAPVWERKISEFWKTACYDLMRLFLRGLYTANGSVLADGNRISLKTSSKQLAHDVAEMLEWLGIRAYITTNKPTEVQFENGKYLCKESFDVNTVNVNKFMYLVGFEQRYKISAANIHKINKPGKLVRVVRVESLGTMEVFDYTVDAEEHTVVQKGLLVSNCGEIPISALGGYCSIGDIVPYHCDNLPEFEEAARLTVRALMRINGMDCIYRKEVTRTNRIGVSLTGIHEYAWKAYKLGFSDLINEEKSKPFWLSLAHVSRALKEEAASYAKQKGLNVPHTDTAIKPAGTTSKLFGLTEGANLAPMREYLRWVQFMTNDPLVSEYKKLGYPVRTLKTYKDTSIVAFPTQPTICKLNMGDKLITASEATPAQHFEFLRLLEKYWIQGLDENNKPLPDTGGQVSYTLKYSPSAFSLEDFRKLLLTQLNTIKCCSVMQDANNAEEAYEYLPEQSVTIEVYNNTIKNIKQEVEEDVDREHVACQGGSCPVELKGKSVTTADCGVV